MTKRLILKCGDIDVGAITEAFEHQGTWFGSFQCLLPEDSSTAITRLREFILFCQDWFSRSGKTGADAAEFDPFEDIVAADWSTEDRNGERLRIVEAPLFQDGLQGEISWQNAKILELDSSGSVESS